LCHRLAGSRSHEWQHHPGDRHIEVNPELLIGFLQGHQQLSSTAGSGVRGT
jgi:hypothetical protein